MDTLIYAAVAIAAIIWLMTRWEWFRDLVGGTD